VGSNPTGPATIFFNIALSRNLIWKKVNKVREESANYLRNEELREIQSFKAVLNKRTKKWIVLAKFRSGKTKITAGGLNSRKEAQEYLKLLVEDVEIFLKDAGK